MKEICHVMDAKTGLLTHTVLEGTIGLHNYIISLISRSNHETDSVRYRKMVSILTSCFNDKYDQ